LSLQIRHSEFALRNFFQDREGEKALRLHLQLKDGTPSSNLISGTKSFLGFIRSHLNEKKIEKKMRKENRECKEIFEKAF